jgi:mxaD protein
MIARIEVKEIEVRGQIPAAGEAVWAVLGDFGGVASWNPFVADVRIEGDGIGMTRTITPSTGGRIVETLALHDADARRIRYAVQLESGAQSVADIRLDDGGNGGTTVIWRSLRDADLSPEQSNAIVSTLHSRIDALAQALVAKGRVD